MTALTPGQRRGGWQVLRLDATGKRLTVACVSCQRPQQVSTEALMDMSLRKCGCSARPSSRVRAAESFAVEIAELESSTSGKGRYRQ
jgi:hypothetical protein